MNQNTEPRGSDALEAAITAAQLSIIIVERHGCSSPARNDELRRACARLIARHIEVCAIEMMAVAQYELDHMSPEQRAAAESAAADARVTTPSH